LPAESKAISVSISILSPTQPPGRRDGVTLAQAADTAP
jgi:hypothetical protein